MRSVQCKSLPDASLTGRSNCPPPNWRCRRIILIEAPGLSAEIQAHSARGPERALRAAQRGATKVHVPNLT